MKKFILPLCLALTLSTTACVELPYFGQAPKLELPAQDLALAKAANPQQTPAPPVPLLVVQCSVDKGSALFGKNWYDFSESQFSLTQGQKTVVTLQRKHSEDEMSLQARFDDSGQKIVFCPIRDDLPPDARITCASIYALEDDFKMGIKRTLDVPQSMRGGTLRCGYKLPKKS